VEQGLESSLVERWPSWFNVGGDPMFNAMARGFAHGDGWFDILWRLCADLEPLVVEIEKETGERFRVLQVKEKFGTLRFYVSGHTDAIDRRIAEAQEESSRTCEICGQPGRRHEAGGWIQVTCDDHVPPGREF
jgi:hypothetical protein